MALYKRLPQEPQAIAAKQQHPGIDDLQSSSSAALTAGGVELNSVIPGTALNVLNVLKPDETNKAGSSSLPRGPNNLAVFPCA